MEGIGQVQDREANEGGHGGHSIGQVQDREAN